MRNFKEIMPVMVRNNLYEIFEQEQGLWEDLRDRIISSNMGFVDFERENSRLIAQINFGRPIGIPFTDLGIRPFWRDGKEPISEFDKAETKQIKEDQEREKKYQKIAQEIRDKLKTS